MLLACMIVSGTPSGIPQEVQYVNGQERQSHAMDLTFLIWCVMLTYSCAIEMVSRFSEPRVTIMTLTISLYTHLASPMCTEARS